jgi:hypothetical protein
VTEQPIQHESRAVFSLNCVHSTYACNIIQQLVMFQVYSTHKRTYVKYLRLKNNMILDTWGQFQPLVREGIFHTTMTVNVKPSNQQHLVISSSGGSIPRRTDLSTVIWQAAWAYLYYDIATNSNIAEGCSVRFYRHKVS